MIRDDVLVEVVIPVYNEEEQLESSVVALREFLQRNLPYRFGVTIADNASIDNTPAIAQRLAATYRDVNSLRLERKGRGLALRTAWGASKAAIVAYMDVDLSTDLRAFPQLIAPLVAGKSDIAIGSRLGRGAKVTRSPRRELISRGYNAMIRLSFFNH